MLDDAKREPPEHSANPPRRYSASLAAPYWSGNRPRISADRRDGRPPKNDVVTVDERFNLPDNIRVLFADEDKCVAGHMRLRIELTDPIDGHDGGAPQRYTDMA
jgi:hypothetical protein